MQQVARCNTIDVSKTPRRVCLRIDAHQQLEQALVGTIGNSNRRRLLIERLDLAADEIAQKPVQAALLGLVPA